MQWHETFHYFSRVTLLRRQFAQIKLDCVLTNRPIHLAKRKNWFAGERVIRHEFFCTKRKQELFVVLVVVRAKNRPTPSGARWRTHRVSIGLRCVCFWFTGCQIRGTIANVPTTKTTTQCSNAKVMTCRSVELSNRLQKKKSKADEKHSILKFTRQAFCVVIFGNWRLDQIANKIMFSSI